MDPPVKEPSPFAATSRRLVPLTAAFPAGAPPPPTAIPVVVAGEGESVGVQYSDAAPPQRLERGVAEANPTPDGSRRGHLCQLIGTLFVAGGIGLTVWCSVDAGEYHKLIWTEVEVRAPCNASGVGVPLLAALLVPFLWGVCFLWPATRSSLYKLVTAGVETTPAQVGAAMAAMDAGVPTCEAYIETYHYESRGSGKNRRRVKVTTYRGTQPLQVVGCASVPGTELAPQLAGALRDGMLGTVFSTAVGIDLPPESEAAVLAAVNALVAEHGARDAHFHVGWRFTCTAWQHKFVVATGSASPAAFWVSVFTLTHWLWTRYTEARVHRVDATLVKHVSLAPFVPPALAAVNAAAAAAYAAGMGAAAAAYGAPPPPGGMVMLVPAPPMVAVPGAPMAGYYPPQPGTPAGAPAAPLPPHVAAAAPYLTVRVQQQPLQQQPQQQQQPAAVGPLAYGGQAYGAPPAPADVGGAAAAPPSYAPGYTGAVPSEGGAPALAPSGPVGGYANIPEQFRYAPQQQQ